MAGRGVHFALTDDQEARLLGLDDGDDAGLLALVEELEEGPGGGGWDAEWTLETDKAWEAIHRCLTGGSLEYGETPFHLCILPHGNLCDDDDYTVCYAERDEVKRAAAALAGVDRADLRRRYDALDPDDYSAELSDADFESTWENFVDLRAFFQKAAAAGRAVIFTVDS